MGQTPSYRPLLYPGWEPDGYTIGFSHFIPFLSNEILLDKKPPVDYNKFAVLLQITHSRHFIFLGEKSPFKSRKDLKNAGRPIKFSGTGVGAITWVEGSAVGLTVGFPVSFVTGYRNLPAAAMATSRGDAEAGALTVANRVQG